MSRWPRHSSVHVQLICYFMTSDKATFIDSENRAAKTWTGCTKRFYTCFKLFFVVVHFNSSKLQDNGSSFKSHVPITITTVDSVCNVGFSVVLWSSPLLVLFCKCVCMKEINNDEILVCHSIQQGVLQHSAICRVEEYLVIRLNNCCLVQGDWLCTLPGLGSCLWTLQSLPCNH